ncbi:hypothetical protein [Glycomyces tarimensis]
METDGIAVASAMRRHADTLDGLRYRTEAIRFASTLMPRDAAAYGTMCGWIADCLEDRTQRQDGLVEYVAENLRIAAGNLRTAAAAYEGRAAGPTGEPDALGTVNDAVFRASYWYPGRSSEPLAEPAPRLADQIQPLVDEISGRSWADEQFAGGDGFGSMPIARLDVAIAHFDAMRELLSQLVGRPEIVAAQASAWNDMSAELYRIGRDLEFHLDRDLLEWKGEDHAAYQALMEHNVEAIGGVGATAAALGAAVEGAGVVVASALDLVRGRSVELAAHVVRWAAEANPAEPSATPLQLAAAVTKWALMVMGYVMALARSLHNLRMLLEG